MIIEMLSDYIVACLIEEHKHEKSMLIRYMQKDSHLAPHIERDSIASGLDELLENHATFGDDAAPVKVAFAPILARIIYQSISADDSNGTLQSLVDEQLALDDKRQYATVVTPYLTEYIGYFLQQMDSYTFETQEYAIKALSELQVSLQSRIDENRAIAKSSTAGLRAQTLEPIFISYSRANTDFASELEQTLKSLGFKVMRDRVNLKGGRDWWAQLQNMIRQARYMVLCLSPEAIASEYVADEWQYARQVGTPVIPIFAADVDIAAVPKWMKQVHWFDFRDEMTRNEPDVQWNSFVGQLNSPPDTTRVPFMIDQLSEDYVIRQKPMQHLIATYVDDSRDAIVTTTALLGSGGLGKTTLARALCHESAIRAAFYDGILWVTLGDNITGNDIVAKILELVVKINGTRPNLTSIEAATDALRKALEDRNLLLVIDDVWNAAHLKPFLEGGNKCARLITTRDSDTLPASVKPRQVDAMTVEEATQLLKFNLPGNEIEHFHNELRQLAESVGRWPLLLKLANGNLQDDVETGYPLKKAIENLVSDLKEGGLTELDHDHDMATRNRAVTASMEASISRLGRIGDDRNTAANYNAADLYRKLAIFPEDTDIPLKMAAYCWGIDERQARKICKRLHDKSLIMRFEVLDGMDYPSLRMHDVIRQYLIDTGRTKLAGWNQEFIANLKAAYRVDAWYQLPVDEPYIWTHLASHMLVAEQFAELHDLLTASEKWMENKYEATQGDNSYVDDLKLLIDTYKDPLNADNLIQLLELYMARHMVGERLLGFSNEIFGLMTYVGRGDEAINLSLIDPNARSQISALAAIYPYQSREAQPAARRRIFELINRLPNNDKGSVVFSIAVVAEKLDVESAQEIFDRILALIRNTDDDGTKSRMLSQFVGVISRIEAFDETALLQQSVDIAASLVTHLYRAEALLAIITLKDVDIIEKLPLLEQVLISVSQIEKPKTKNSSLRQIAAVTSQFDIERALEIAMTISDEKLKQSAICAIAVETANTDADRALQIADMLQSNRERDEGLVEIVENVSVTDIEKALEIASTITDIHQKERALAACAGAVSRVDLDRALEIVESIRSDSRRATALENIGESIATIDCAKALGIAEKIERDSEKQWVLVRIIQEYGKQDGINKAFILRQVLNVASSIKESYSKGYVFAEVAKEMAMNDMDAALELSLLVTGYERMSILDKIVSHIKTLDIESAAKWLPRVLEIARTAEYTDARDTRLIAIACELCKLNIEPALAIVNQIDDTVTRVRGLTKLAKAYHEIDAGRSEIILQGAKETADTIEDINDKLSAFIKGAEELYKVNHVVAIDQLRFVIEQVSTITIVEERVIILQELARTVSEWDESQARQILRDVVSKTDNFDDVNDIDNVLHSVASSMSHYDLDGALAFTDRIESESTKESALSRIYIEMSKTDLDRALKEGMKAIEGDYERDSMLWSISVELCKSDLGKALELVGKMENKSYKDSVYSEIAGQRAKTDMKQAEEILLLIEDTYNMRDAHKNIAKVIAGTGNYAHALDEYGDTYFESFVQWVAEMRPYIEEHYPDESQLWLRLLHHAMKIVCWVRPSWSEPRDIVGGMIQQDS